MKYNEVESYSVELNNSQTWEKVADEPFEYINVTGTYGCKLLINDIAEDKAIILDGYNLELSELEINKIKLIGRDDTFNSIRIILMR